MDIGSSSPFCGGPWAPAVLKLAPRAERPATVPIQALREVDLRRSGPAPRELLLDVSEEGGVKHDHVGGRPGGLEKGGEDLLARIAAVCIAGIDRATIPESRRGCRDTRPCGSRGL